MLKKILLFITLSLTVQLSIAEPLQGRKFGVEFNLPRVILYNDRWKSMSGTFSYFNHQNKTELAFPWLIVKQGSGDEALIEKSLDFHYRKFIDNKLNGLYFSGFARITNLDGTIVTSSQTIEASPNSTTKPGYIDQQTESLNKTRFGLGIGLGVRVFSEKSRMYWGSSVMIGRYLDNNSYNFINENNDTFWPFVEDKAIIVDVELLKFGYAF